MKQSEIQPKLPKLEFKTNSTPLVNLNPNDKPKLKRTGFSEGLRFLCLFCGGKSCKHENYLANSKENAFKGLNSNWITDQILAMQRPSSRIIKQFDLIKQFQDKQIKAIFCLQEPGEHPICGDGINKQSGLSYLPEEFYKHQIHFYNFGWRDHETTDVYTLVKIIKTMNNALIQNFKLAVHCHAGKGRTGLVICGYLMFKNNWTAKKAIDFFKERREGSLKKKSQIETLMVLEEFIKIEEKIYYCNNNYVEVITKEKMMNFKKCDKVKKFDEFYDSKNIYIPKIIKICLKRLMYLGRDAGGDAVLEKFFMKSEDIVGLEEIKFKIKEDNKLEEIEKLDSIDKVVNILKDFFKDLKDQILKSVTLEGIRFLIMNHFDFESSFQKDGLIHQKNINKNELGLLFELNYFYNKLQDYTPENYEKSLFVFSILLLNESKQLSHLFEDGKLIKCDWEIDKNLKTIWEFFEILTKSDYSYIILRNNVNIYNSPLKSFSIKRKNQSISMLSGNENFKDFEEITEEFHKTKENSKMRKTYDGIKESSNEKEKNSFVTFNELNEELELWKEFNFKLRNCTLKQDVIYISL